MALSELQKAIEEKASEQKEETGSVWAISVRLDPKEEKDAKVIKAVKDLMASSGLSAGRIAIELLEEAINSIDFGGADDKN